MKWRSIMHPAQFHTDPLGKIRMMKDAGCIKIVMGIQSTDNEVLRNVKRRSIDLEKLNEIIRYIKRVGMVVTVHYIMGLPGDNQETMQKNLDHALETKPHYADFYSLIVLPGSEIEREYINKGISPHPGFTEEEVKKIAENATIKFYNNPKVMSQLLSRALVMNPKWLKYVYKHRKDYFFPLER